VNTSANPVPTSPVNVTDPGRIAYQSTVDNTGKCSGTACIFSFPVVPAGHRVVVQHIAGNVDFTSPAPSTIDVRILIGGVFISQFFAPIPAVQEHSGFDQPVLFYIDQLNSAQVSVLLGGLSVGPFDAGALDVLTLTGYELDCTVAACAPIATQ